MENETIQILELFGGIGSPRCALRNLNIPTKAIDYVEINEKAVRSYNSMFREELAYKTQTVVGWNLKPDILIHGSPCQDMSIAGHQGKATGEGRINRGKGSDEGSGTRSSLMWETIHIIENMGEWRPRYVIWENVKNVKSKYMRPNFDRYMVEMERLGYTNNFEVLDAREFGLPQARERVFTVSVLNGERFEFDTAPNIVNREFEEHGPRKILLTDITYIINGKAPRCYMATIIDACTKELLSWVLSESLEIDFVLETVKQLIEKHGTDLSTETLIHSDQGSHYTSIKFIQLLKDNELRQSMSRRANCWDNAPQESFFGHMKDELDLSECYSYEEILNAVRDWTEYYNTERYQWDLARLSPVEYYQYMTTGIYPLIIPKAKGENNQSEASL